mmetsp:Transcript_48310/g.118249  ORF Transcript_48310/g.118249 Transcript_48310/m.118249 type:complete len:204 (-) Transcript_48310:297-908(-)
MRVSTDFGTKMVSVHSRRPIHARGRRRRWRDGLAGRTGFKVNSGKRAAAQTNNPQNAVFGHLPTQRNTSHRVVPIARDSHKVRIPFQFPLESIRPLVQVQHIQEQQLRSFRREPQLEDRSQGIVVRLAVCLARAPGSCSTMLRALVPKGGRRGCAGAHLVRNRDRTESLAVFSRPSRLTTNSVTWPATLVVGRPKVVVLSGYN